MLAILLLLVCFNLSCGLDQGNSLPAAIDLRHYCTAQHFGNTYKVSCNGATKHFKNKNLTLDSRSAFGITEVELYSFDNVNFISQTSTDWDSINKITIKNSKKINFLVQSSIILKQLEIDLVDELAIEANTSSYSVIAQKIVLSNVGKLNLPYSKNAEIKSSVLTFINITDVDLDGQLKASGELLTVSQCNIDLTEHSKIALKFASVIIKESTKLYIQETGQLDVLSDFFIIQESYIFMNGKINIIGYEFLENRKEIKFFNNSIYGMKKSGLNIYGDKNEIKFLGNGIYRSDIGEVLAVMGGMIGVTFKHNLFGCNKCTNKQLFQAEYRLDMGEQNFCDLTCNLTLTRYKVLLDKEKICSQVEFADEHDLCLSDSNEDRNPKSGVQHYWFVIPVIFVLFLCTPTVLYFYCKRHSPRFRPVPVDHNVVPSELTNITQENQSFVSRAFNNDVYGQVDSNPDNVYETVDHIV